VDISRSIFFFPTYTREGRWFFVYDVCACAICTYNWNRIIACGIVGQTRSNCSIYTLYSHNPTQTDTNYYYHQTPVIFRSNSNAIHNLTTLTVFIQCLQNTRGSPRFWKWRSTTFPYSLSETNPKMPTYITVLSYSIYNKNI